MKKLVISLIFIGTSSFALEGKDVYKKYCSACHIDNMNMQQMQKVEQIVKSGGKLPIKAPPFNEVSARIKYFYPEKKDFIKFVVDYITNPSKEKAKCMPMAIKKFGLMPPIGKQMTEEEKLAVANWLYDNYNQKWEDMPMGKMKFKMQGHHCNENCGCKHKHHKHME